MGNPAANLSGDVGGYRILGPLHEGGDGITYRAIALDTSLPAVIKVPRVEHPSALSSFLDEIASLELLNRAGVRGVVDILASGFLGKMPWYAMNWIDGRDLGAHIRQLWDPLRGTTWDPTVGSDTAAATVDVIRTRETTTQGPSDGRSIRAERSEPPKAPGPGLDPDSLRNALQLLRELAMILAEVHAQGLLHGDLSPSNIMLSVNQTPTLLDFGTALAVFEPGRSREVVAVSQRRRATPGYAAPEVFRDELLDSRCDIYSLGCMALELLTGSRPFPGTTPDDLVRQHLHHGLEFSEAAGDLPEALLRLLRRMLEKDRSRRVSHAIEVAEELSQWASDSRSMSAGSRTLGMFRPRLAGRDGVVARIRRVFDDGRRGQGGLILLRGASGQGKTRLLNELGFHAERAGAEVVVCRCTRASALGSFAAPVLSSGLELFAPFFERLGSVISEGHLPLSEDHRDPIRLALSAVQPYSPIGLCRHEPTPLPQLSAPAAIQRVLRSLLTLLQQLGSVHPLVLLLDDLQWVDHLSARFLSTAIRELNESPVVVVCALRDEAGHLELEQLRAGCRNEEVLEALPSEQVRGLVKDLLGAELVPDGFLDFIMRYSEGAPFYVAEYTRAALREGWLQRESPGGWTFTWPGEATAATGLTQGIDQILLERARDLSPMAVETLKFAAVLGREFDAADLERSDAKACRAALGELMAREILCQLALDRYRFSHDAIRDAHERALDPAERRRLHRLAIDVVSTRSFPRELQRLARLGHHWAAAGEPARSLEHLERAAAEAMQENSLSLAADLYRAAHDQCELAEPRNPHAVAKLAESLGDALITLARHAEARARYREALQLRSGASQLTQARLWRKQAASCWTLHEYNEAGQALNEAEQALLLHDDSGPEHYQELIQIKVGRFEQLYFSQKKGPAIESMLAELRTLVEAHGTAPQKNAYFVAACSHAMFRRRYAFDPTAVSLARHALDASTALPLEAKALARFVYGFSLVMGSVERCRESLPHLELASREAEAAFSTTLMARIATYRAVAALRLHDIDGTIAAATAARAAAEAAQQPPYIATSIACVGWAAWRRGEPDGRQLLEQAHQMWVSHRHPFPLRWIASLPLLAFTLVDDDFEKSKLFLDELIDDGQQALPDDLTAAIRAAASACVDAAPRVAATKTEQVLRLAQDLGFC